MVEAVREKNPAKVKAGRAGMLRRWGPPGTRVVRLDALDPAVRLAIVTLIDEAKKAAAGNQDPAAAKEARRGDDEPSAP